MTKKTPDQASALKDLLPAFVFLMFAMLHFVTADTTGFLDVAVVASSMLWMVTASTYYLVSRFAA